MASFLPKTVTRRLLLAVANIMVSKREGEIIWYLETRRLKAKDPSMTDPMKQANIMPKGKSGGEFEPYSWAAFKAGVQKKTKRYIEPSKKQDARPRVKIFLSEKTILRTFLAGTSDSSPCRLSP